MYMRDYVDSHSRQGNDKKLSVRRNCAPAALPHNANHQVNCWSRSATYVRVYSTNYAT